MRRVCLVALALALAGGCGQDQGNSDAAPINCALEMRADTYAANMVKSGSMANFKVMLVESMPAPPAKGDNNFSLRLLDSGDAPVDGAGLSVTPFMPDHGHGTPIEAIVTAVGSNGDYSVVPVNLWMPGLWEIMIDIDDNGTIDGVIFRFCIEG